MTQEQQAEGLLRAQQVRGVGEENLAGNIASDVGAVEAGVLKDRDTGTLETYIAPERDPVLDIPLEEARPSGVSVLVPHPSARPNEQAASLTTPRVYDTSPVVDERGGQRTPIQRRPSQQRDILFALGRPGALVYDLLAQRLGWEGEQGSARHAGAKLSRRQFVIEGPIDGAAWLIYLKGASLLIPPLLDSLWSQAKIQEPERVGTQSVRMLSLFNVANTDLREDGFTALARDTAIALSNVKDPGNPSTWGWGEATDHFKSLERLFSMMTTSLGRVELYSDITHYATSEMTRNYYFVAIGRFENYLTRNHILDNVSRSELRTYFTTPTVNGGLGYTAEQWQLIVDTLDAYKSGNITPGIRQRYNAVNDRTRDSGTKGLNFIPVIQ